MAIQIKTEKEHADYQAVADILDHFGLSHYDAETERRIFENSYAVSFVYDGDRLVGCGRAISDGICQGAIYNVALLEDYQGRELGRLLVQKLLEQMPGQNVILYTHPQTVSMYEKFGFRRAKSAMEYFPMEREHAQWMEDEGFFLPEGFRFADEYKREDMKGPKWKKRGGSCENGENPEKGAAE